MSKENFFRPIRGDVWYFSTKSIARGVGVSAYRAGNLGIRLVEEESIATEKIVRGSCSEDGRLSGRVAFDFYNQNLKHENFGFRIVEELG